MPLLKFESMLKSNNVYFFDAIDFEDIIQHYMNIGKHTFAQKAIQLGLEQHPSSVSLRLFQSELFIFDNKIELAVKLLNEIEAIEPYNDEVFIQKATILSKTNQHKEAIKVLKSAIEFIEDPIDIWSLIGMEYLYLDDFENAKSNFEKCIELDCNDYASLYNIIYCFEMNERHEDAIHFLNQYIDKNPYSEVAWHQLGRQYFTLDMFKEALTSFDYAVIIDEGFIGGYLEKAKTLEQLSRYEEAIENYLITLELDDPTAFAYIRIGECFEKLNIINQAIFYYKKAVEEDPLLDKGWLLLTNLHYKIEDYEQAIYYINKAIDINDSNPVYWRKCAEINIKLNCYNKAAEAFKTSIDLGDIDIDIYIALADILLFLNQHKDALNLLIKAKKTYREFAEIEYRLCGLFMLENKKDFSLTHLKNGLAIDFEHHIIIENLFPKVFKLSEVQNIIFYCNKTINDYQ